MRRDVTPWLPWYCLGAGAMDTATGLLLIGAPATTLGLMGASDAFIALHAPLILIRFVGAFVAAVGLAYWLPFVRAAAPARSARITVVLEVTALVRAVIGTFALVAVVTAALEIAFLAVAATDLSLAAFQVVALRQGRHAHD